MEGQARTSLLLDVAGVDKRFGETVALKDASLQVRPGEIHGLLGQNGAGKSTIVKILAGVYQRDSGSISVDGVALGEHIHPAEARRLGLSFIHQDLGLIEESTIAENMAFGLGFPTRAGLLDRRAMAEQASSHLHDLGVELDPERRVSSLNGAEQALVAIARAIVTGARLLVLDEPTARLHGAEVELLHHQLDGLRKRSLGFIYVTHRLDEVFSLTDRVTVFRNGSVAAARDTKTLSEDDLIQLIVGRSVETGGSAHGANVRADEPDVLVVDSLETDVLDGLTLSLRKGEILGIAGPAGPGSSLSRVIAGVEPPRSGTVTLNGEPAPRRIRDAVQRGVVMVPENRRRDGLSVAATIAENLGLAYSVLTERPRQGSLRRWLTAVSPRRSALRARDVLREYAVKASGPDALVSGLSGGNQQKVLIAKWLQKRPTALILDEPTQGVDVGTRSEIYAIIQRLAADGIPILVSSSDAQELATLCDRVAVLRSGRVGAMLVGQTLTQDSISAEILRTRPGPDPDVD